MASVRLDVTTEATLGRLAALRGQTKSEVLRDAILRLADDEPVAKTAYDRLRPFIGAHDSGGLQLSARTGDRLRELLTEKHRARRSR